MPKDYFSVQNTTDLSALPADAKIHFIGVCGVAMAQLAVELAVRGYQVSGSDKEFYEPMGSLLKNSKVKLFQGYAAENISADVDLVLIGNAVSYENPEVAAVEARELAYSLFTKLLYETLIAGNHSIVVSGTHGKSTTSALAAHVLSKAGYEPSFFVGGIVPEFGKSLHLGSGEISVVEGDEYDSAFFAKVPKFSFYAPNTLIVTSVEFDHADIYTSYEAIEKEFTKLVASMSSKDRVIICIDSQQTNKLSKQWEGLGPEIISYGINQSAKIRLAHRRINNFRQTFEILGLTAQPIKVEIGISGEYNALNAIAVITAAYYQGCDLKKLVAAISTFTGLKRRQEIRFANDKYILIEDFAHHPTAVKKTLAGLRELYPDNKLRVAFEPRSATSKLDIFQKDYISSFIDADEVCICEIVDKNENADKQYLDVHKLANEISDNKAKAFENPQAIADYLLSTLSTGDVLILMSNGAFGGIAEHIENQLNQK
ncbi:MAG: Mur ligase family protein [Bdellovibrionota bacterium]